MEVSLILKLLPSAKFQAWLKVKNKCIGKHLLLARDLNARGLKA
jgi:hypothetical protein